MEDMPVLREIGRGGTILSDPSSISRSFWVWEVAIASDQAMSLSIEVSMKAGFRSGLR